MSKISTSSHINALKLSKMPTHITEQHKKLKYATHIIEVENSSFNPLVFACTGGAGLSTTKVMKKLVDKIADKKNKQYSGTISLV